MLHSHPAQEIAVVVQYGSKFFSIQLNHALSLSQRHFWFIFGFMYFFELLNFAKKLFLKIRFEIHLKEKKSFHIEHVFLTFRDTITVVVTPERKRSA